MTNKFIDMEKKYKLFTELEYENLNYWHFIRMQIYMRIFKEIRELDNMHPDLENKNKKKYVDFGCYFIDSLFKNLKYKKSPKSFLISCTSRKEYMDGSWVNPLTFTINNYYENNSIIFELASLTSKEYDIKLNSPVFYSAVWELTRAIHIYIFRAIKNHELIKQAEKIQKYVYEFFNIKLDIKWISYEIVYSIQSYKVLYPKFVKFLKDNKIKCIIEVCHYNRKHMILNMAAHSCNIQVLELQHGIMGKEHIAYNLNLIDQILPDKILTFGQYWIDSADYPDKTSRMVAVGYPYYEKRVKYYKKNKLEKKAIIILSQGPFGHKMSSFAIELNIKIHEKQLDYKIIYKLHPNEYKSWKKLYPQLIEYPDILVVDNDETQLYDYFSISQIQVGVNSTAIFEGLGFGLQTFFLNYLKIDFVEDLVCKNVAVKISSVNEMLLYLENNNKQLQDFKSYSDYFWERDAEKKMIKEIDKYL